jgi:hypothetical protein
MYIVIANLKIVFIYPSLTLPEFREGTKSNEVFSPSPLNSGERGWGEGVKISDE